MNLSRLVVSGACLVLSAGIFLLSPAPVSAELPELRIAPLRYEAHLELGQLKTGFVDASNPTGSTIHVAFQVQAFKQVNDSGELTFFDDPRITAAVTPAVSEFDIGPREAVRTRFTIDPSALGPGGAYGVIFLRTVPTGQAEGEIATSARVGTLLILDVGGTGIRSGRISDLKLPHFVFGQASLPLSFSYANSGNPPDALAFFPKLDTSSGFTARPDNLTGPLVFPQRTRVVKTTLHPGNALGIIAVSVHDRSGGSKPATAWILADTGIWAYLTFLMPVLFILLPLRSTLLTFVLKLRRVLRNG